MKNRVQAMAPIQNRDRAGIKITGIAGSHVRNFYHRDAVLTKGFRETSVKQVVDRVKQGGGWLVISGDSSVAGLIETGRKFQRMELRLRERGIAICRRTGLIRLDPRSLALHRGINSLPTEESMLALEKLTADSRRGLYQTKMIECAP